MLLSHPFSSFGDYTYRQTVMTSSICTDSMQRSINKESPVVFKNKPTLHFLAMPLNGVTKRAKKKNQWKRVRCLLTTQCSKQLIKISHKSDDLQRIRERYLKLFPYASAPLSIYLSFCSSFTASYREWAFTIRLHRITYLVNKPPLQSAPLMRPSTERDDAWLAIHRKLNQQRYV